MAKTTKKTTRINKKNKLHLKKSARWTIAGLMLTTAIIIALIPVQGGGVYATSGNNNGPFASTPSLNTIVTKTSSSSDEGYALFSDEEMSVKCDASSQEYKGFPIKHKGDNNIEPHELVYFDVSEDDAAAIQIVVNNFYSYEMRDKDNNIIEQGSNPGEWNISASDKFFIINSELLPSSEEDKSIFRMGSKDVKTDVANVVTKYVGGINGYSNNGVVSLDDGTVGYSKSDWGYEYRRLTVKRYAEAVDSDNNPLGVPDINNVAYEETFLVCTNRATVQYIADDAFKNNDPNNPANIVELTLPNNLLRIGNQAFQGQSNIASINGGQSLKNIGKLAFEGCSSLNTVSFNDKIAPLENVGDGAFANCTALSSISLPNTTAVIGSGAFYGCKSLNDSNSDVVSENDSMIFSRTKGSDISMKLGDYVFAGCEQLTNIALDKDITEIGRGVFADCQNLKTVVLPGKDNTINYSPSTFANDHNILYVRIPDDDTSHIFKNSDGSEDMTTKPCIFVTSINQEQNSNDTETLEPITMNNEYFSIWGPKPEISSKIHKYAQTYGITYMYEKDGIIYYELTLNGYTFSFNQEGIIIGCECARDIKQEPNLIIPPKIGGVNIVGIAPDAFKEFKPNGEGYPKSITIKENIKTIGDNAFYDCNSIEEVYIETSGVNIGESAFAECDKLKNVKFTQVGESNGETYIGNNCFLNDKQLELCAFRNTDLDMDNINVVNVKNIGTNAFRTGNDNGLTIVGNMDTDYVPYNFAIDPRNKTSAGSNSYITYKTGNPHNLVCKYDTTLIPGENSNIDPEYGVLDGKVRLVSYPVADTVVGTNGGIDITIHDLQEKIDNYNSDPENYPQPTVMEHWIVEKMKNIALPEGIVTIDKSKSDNNKTTIGNKLMSQLNEPSDSKENIGGAYVECDNKHALQSIEFAGVKEIPDESFKNDNNLDTVKLEGEIDEIGNGAFAGCDKLETITIGSSEKEIKSIGENAFGGYEDSYVPGKRTIYDCCDSLKNVKFLGNITDPNLTSNVFYGAKELTNVELLGDNKQGKDNATTEDPYYWCEDGIIYKYDGSDTVLVECLPGVAQTSIRSDVNEILPGAFENCDKLAIVDLSNCNELYELPDRCFYDCDSLRNVTLSKTCSSIGEKAFACDYDNQIARASQLDVTMLAHEIYLDTESFIDREPIVEGATPLSTIHSYDETAAQRYAKKMPNVNFVSDVYDDVLIRFVYYKDNEPVIDESYWPYKSVPKAPDVPSDGRSGYEFTGTWSDQIVEATEFKQYTAKYKLKENSSNNGATTPNTTTPNTTAPNTTTPSTTKPNSSVSSSSSSTNKSSSASSTNNRPVVISGAPTPVVQPGSANSSASGGAASSSPSGSNVTTGNTNVVSTAPGLSNNGKMSATVNGSSDNYVIKLTETAEADECAKQALSAAFGSLDNIRYMPFDISLYDSTGTQKISPVPEGVTVSVTMPIPDSLQVYGGNNKVASTVGGTLESIKPRFTVIDGVPCMNFTVSHLSPYVIYVDTANLTASGTLDATPKTGDPIHPKWFLCIGLTAISIFLFLKRDKDTLRAA